MEKILIDTDFCHKQRCELTALTLLHSEWPKLYRVLAILSAIGLRENELFRNKDVEKREDQ